MSAPWSQQPDPSLEEVQQRLFELVAWRLVGRSEAEVQEYEELLELEARLLDERPRP